MLKFWRLLTSRTPPILGADGRVKPGSIAALERWRIGGIEQTLLLRGHDVSRPVLLFLHGGPGGTAMPLAHWFSSRLEEQFVVVNWDQRGAGKSWSPDIPRGSMTTERFIEDCREVAEQLCARFGQRRVFVMGHSWGSELGVLTVQRHPHLFAAYVAVAQVVNKRRAEQISWQFALDAARRKGDIAIERRLAALEPPAYGGNVADLLFQRQCVSRYGGSLFDPSLDKRLFLKYFESHEYSLADLRRLKKGSQWSLQSMWQERLDVDLVQTASRLQVPVVMLHGRCDRVTPTELAQEYFDALQAPYKRLVWFDKSGHCPIFEEPERFQQVVAEELGRFDSPASA